MFTRAIGIHNRDEPVQTLKTQVFRYFAEKHHAISVLARPPPMVVSKGERLFPNEQKVSNHLFVE